MTYYRKKSRMRRKRNLMARDPHCYWCGCEVFLYRIQPKMRVPDNAATIDHLFSRVIGPRKNLHQEVTVLSCKKCNEERSEFEQQEEGIFWVWQRSGAFPRWFLTITTIYISYIETYE